MKYIKKGIFIGIPIMGISSWITNVIMEKNYIIQKNKQIDENLDKIIKEYNFVSTVDNHIYVNLDRIYEEEHDAMYILYRYINTLDNTIPLNLHLETIGGQAEGCFKTCDLIKKWKNVTNIYVDNHALSCGTVIALSADNLYIEDDAILSAINICFVDNGKKLFDKKMLCEPKDVGGYLKYIDLFLYFNLSDIVHRRKIKRLINKKYNVNNIMYYMYDNVTCHATHFDRDAFLKISSV